jgi:hypothetical protein
MRSAAITILCGLFFNIGLAQINSPPSLEPTPLEAFAGQPTARVTRSKEVGRIESAEARVIVTALIVEDAVKPHRMSGVRIGLTNQKATDEVYLDEPKLEELKKALEEIERGIEDFRNEQGDAPLRYLGSCKLRQPRPTFHTLSAAYYIAPNSSGLSLSAYKGQEFRFPNHRTSELAEAIGRAMEELKSSLTTIEGLPK